MITGSVPSASLGRNQGIQSVTGLSSRNRPRSISASAATETIGFVREANRKTVSSRTRHSFLPVGEAGGAPVNDLAVFGHQDDRADDALFPDRLIDHGIKARFEQRLLHFSGDVEQVAALTGAASRR